MLVVYVPVVLIVMYMLAPRCACALAWFMHIYVSSVLLFVPPLGLCRPAVPTTTYHIPIYFQGAGCLNLSFPASGESLVLHLLCSLDAFLGQCHQVCYLQH